MINELTHRTAEVAVQTNTQVSLLDMRKDPKRFPRLGTYPREQAVFAMSKIVSQAYLYKGQSADPTTIQFIACSLVDELMSDPEGMKTRNISFEEISRVIKRAVLNDDMFLSVSSFYKVIMTYVKGEGHQLQQQVVEMQRIKEEKELKDSVIAPMLQAYAGQFLKNNKV